MKKENKYIIALSLVHIFIMLIMLFAVMFSGRDYIKLLLYGENYYNPAKSFVNGSTLLHKTRGPILPLIYSILFFFPQSMHPFLRLLISSTFSFGVIIILFKITKDYISEKQFFIGSLIFILNPGYNHWTFKSAPEIYLGFFLGLFILTFIKYYKSGARKYLIYSILIFILSIFLKPTFLFIPFLLLLTSIFIIKSKRIFIISLVLIILSLGGYITFDRITEPKYDPRIDNAGSWICGKNYGKTYLIMNSFWVDYVIKTKRFGALYKEWMEIYDGWLKNFDKWMKTFYKKYPNSNYLFMNLYFIYDKPLLFLQKLLVNPLFYFSMSGRPLETFIKLLVNIISLILSISGLKTILKNSKTKNEIILIVSIIAGYAMLHFITHATDRLSLPILPYLYVWGGISCLKFKKKVLNFSKCRGKRAVTGVVI